MLAAFGTALAAESLPEQTVDVGPIFRYLKIPFPDAAQLLSSHRQVKNASKV